MTNSLISVIIPVYRNQDTLATLYAQVIDNLPTAQYEFVFVNDCSPDDSLAVLKSLTKNDTQVLVISLSKNVGQNQAIAYGIEHSMGDVVIIMDADLQDPPAAIPQLLDMLEKENVAAVFAGRRGRYSVWHRRLTSIIFKSGLALLSGFRLPVDAGLFVAMQRPMVVRILEIHQHGGYILNAIAKSGLKMTSIPVERAGSSQTNYTFGMRWELGKNAVRDMLNLTPKTQIPDDIVLSFVGNQFDNSRK